MTTNYFDPSGRNWKTTLPDGTSVTNVFYVTGQLKKNTGSRVYPAQYTQDDQGRSKTLTTWQNVAASSGSAVTTWNYDSQRGLLSSKRYADNTGPNYTNTAAGRLKNRLWARNLNTTYAYNNAGDLSITFYSDGTAGVTNSFDRRGRSIQTLGGMGSTTSQTYNDANALLSESYSGGVLNGLAVTNGYDELLRRTNLTLNTPLSTINSTFGYDSASRLLSVAAGVNSAGYSYLADSTLVGEIYYTNNGTLRMTRSNQFDNLNRLTNLVWSAGGSNVASFVYQYNDANQRTRVTLTDGSYWLYQYDALGQVTSAKRYWSDATPVAGQQSTFTFDDTGNRKTTAVGGDQAGANLRSANYAANTLNQITSREVPGYVNILGTATNTATVSLWSMESTALYTPTTRKGDYFRGEMPLNNSTGAVWLTITNIAALSNSTGADIVATTAGKLFVPKTAETFSYDLDGNLTNDGRWTYTWDAENRVTSFTRNSTAPSGSKVKLDCQYDSRSRRTQKIVSTWNGSAYVAQSTNKFVYDGWNLMAILDATNGLVQSFTWGTDASGTMQGAGGVGGLISMTVHQGTNAGTYFYCFDGTYNVTALVNATNGAVAAQYEYDAFLGILRATGPLAFENPFVGSTKFCDLETGFLYYGYRYYDPDTGRWLSRDPIGERGGINIYSYSHNSATVAFDAFGLDSIYSISVATMYNDHTLGEEYLGLTSIFKEELSHKTPRKCGAGRVQVYDIRVIAQLRKQFAMSAEEAKLYQVGDNEWANIQAHEDTHEAIYRTRYVLMYNGFSLLYNQCVCRSCYDQWVKYIDFLDLYTKTKMNLANSQLDWDAYQDPASRVVIDRITSGLPNLDENMRLHGQLLIGACAGVVKAAP